MDNSVKIILASNSPRRRKILHKAGYKFTVYPSNINEDSDEKNPHRLAEKLAKEKAKSVSKTFPNSIVIAADTVVWVEGKILGKPSNPDEAFDMISLLSNRRHLVVTGFAIMNKGKIISGSDKAHIKLRRLGKNEIFNLIEKTNPYDKAGAYSIEELPRDFIKEIKGKVNTILGLPIHIIDNLLKDLTEAY